MWGGDTDVPDKEGSLWVDSLPNQSWSSSYLHAMRDPWWQSKKEACQKMMDWIQLQMNIVSSYMLKGDIEDAYYHMGMALHPIMDSTSLVHKDFQAWHFLDFFYHGDNGNTEEDIAWAMQPENINSTMIRMYQGLHGEWKPCECN